MKTVIETQFSETQFEVSLRDPNASGYITAIIVQEWDDENDTDEMWYSVRVISGYNQDMEVECYNHTAANLPEKFATEGEAIRAMTKRMWASRERLAGNEPNIFCAPESYKFAEK